MVDENIIHEDKIMAKKLRAVKYNDFSKGSWLSIAESLAPKNSIKLGLNLDSDDILGHLVTRKGTTKINEQIINNAPCLGLHQYRDSINSNDMLFGVFSDGTNNDIYDVETDTKVLEDDTADLKTRFMTYLNACLRLNGTDNQGFYNGTTWNMSLQNDTFTAATTDIITSAAHGLLDGDIITFVTTDTLPAGLTDRDDGGIYYVRDKTTDTFKVSLTFDGTVVDITDTGTGTHTWRDWNPFGIGEMPDGAKFAIEFKDRVFLAGFEDDPDTVQISGIANSITRKVSWSEDNKYISFEQEDGGGGITGLAKIPGYVLVFKKRTLKRYDGTSAYPEDMINEGAPSQEAIVVAKGLCGWINENGAWISTGGNPKKISTYTVDKLIKSCPANMLEDMAAGTDEEHLFFSIPEATIDGETYENVQIKYNILQNTWDIRQYYHHHHVYTKFVDSTGETFLTFGDDDGCVHKLDTGVIDSGTNHDDTAITYSLITYDLTFGTALLMKTISEVGFITQNISKGLVLWKDANKQDDEWHEVGTITKSVELFDQLDLRATTYKFKITESVDSGPATIKSIEFPDGIIVYNSSD